MSPERDNIVPFPVPPTRLLRVLIDEASHQHETAHIALRLITHIERTTQAVRCPWCRLPRTARHIP